MPWAGSLVVKRLLHAIPRCMTFGQERFRPKRATVVPIHIVKEVFFLFLFFHPVYFLCPACAFFFFILIRVQHFLASTTRVELIAPTHPE